ncbi:hypothetical protein KKF97_00250, partial [Myxococcota bacterium]|nr:hypothetical protein [Myxococcota bacterium]
ASVVRIQWFMESEIFENRLFSLIFRLDKSAFLDYFSNNAMRRASTLSVLESNHCSVSGGFCPEIESVTPAGISEKSSLFPDPESPVSTAPAFPESDHYSEFSPEPAIEYLNSPKRRSKKLIRLDWNNTGSDSAFTRRWMHPDHLGTASLISNDAGDAESITIYLPNGAVPSASLRESTLEEKSETGFRDPYGFTGKELEVNLGIMYFGARWYNPQLGRWLSPDPLYLVSTAKNAEKDQNIYHYAGNNPWKFVDPDGLQSAGPESRKNQQTVTSKINHVNGYEGSERFAKQVSGALGDIVKGVKDLADEISKSFWEQGKDAYHFYTNPSDWIHNQAKLLASDPRKYYQKIFDAGATLLAIFTGGSSSIPGKLGFSFSSGYLFGRSITAGADDIEQGNKTKGVFRIGISFAGIFIGINTAAKTNKTANKGASKTNHNKCNGGACTKKGTAAKEVECFVGETKVNTSYGLLAISEIHVGSLVYSVLLQNTNDKNMPTDIDGESFNNVWFKLEIVLLKEDGSKVHIDLLRPLWWVLLNNFVIGKTIFISLKEMGIEGDAKITNISPHRINYLKNRRDLQVVTGKFIHENAVVLDLFFNNLKNPLGVTSNHPIWSQTRSDWVSAGQLQIGEYVKTKDGIAQITERRKRPGLHKVYNIEVHNHHTYFVSDLGILVHNDCILPPKKMEAFPDLTIVKRKTPVQGGGGLRKRWKDKEGNIYEWDSQHGRLEKRKIPHPG